MTDYYICIYVKERFHVYSFFKTAKRSNDFRNSTFFYEERNEEIGIIAAECAFEFFKDFLGPHFYNEAIKDARMLMEEKMSSIEDELFSLEKK